MSERIEQLKKSWEKRSCDAREKVRNTIRVMIASEMEITFSGVAKQSGVARSFLYKDPEIKQEIEPKIPYQLYICQPMFSPKSSIISL